MIGLLLVFLFALNWIAVDCLDGFVCGSLYLLVAWVFWWITLRCLCLIIWFTFGFGCSLCCLFVCLFVCWLLVICF